MEDSFLGNRLGDWTLKKQGEGVIIACGIFQIGDKSANRGYALKDGHQWIQLLEKMGKRSTLDMEELRVNSWGGQVSRGTDKDINLFTSIRKRMDLNCEKKRVWPYKTNAAKLLHGLEYSVAPWVMDI
jgi:hypothetical protein